MDEHYEHHHNFFPFVFGDPAELEAEIRRRKDLHEMAAEESAARTNELIDSLDEDRLITLKRMIQTTIGDEHDSYATHMMGWIGSVLHYRFGVCLVCGQKHEEIPTTDELPRGE
jgi:hypothetical protein